MDKKIVEVAKSYARKVRSHMSVQMVMLYGSYSKKGSIRENSDIDIAVIVDKFQGDYLKASADLFGLVRGVDTRIEPVLLSRKNDKSGFLAKILKEGKVIYRAEN